MAGGASSRMKRSLQEVDLKDEVLEAAKNRHKSLIPLDGKGRPLLYFLLQNAANAQIKRVYIITSENNEAFHEFVELYKEDDNIGQLQIKIAIQYVPEHREKPLGTADALEQCLEQYPELQSERFTVCNGDNLYSANVMQLLKKERDEPHAIIAYKGSGLGFDDERLSKFAVMDYCSQRYLQQIIEKPSLQEMEEYRGDDGELSISMNIFNFSGALIYPKLKRCPIHPERNEKELPDAVRMLVQDDFKSVVCIPYSEKIPDLTSANDIATFFNQ